jgi:adenylate kinase
MKHIFIIGPQGSGKGTQAVQIAQTYGLTHIETGLMLRKRAELHDKKAELIDHLANKKGILLPDGIVLDMIDAEIEEKKNPIGYLFDGFPRTVKQYESFKEYLTQRNFRVDGVIYLSIDDEDAIHRLTARRLCRLCRRGYSLLSEPGRTVCECGGLLAVRADDEAPAIARRLTSFHAQTEPILDIMKRDSILFEINGKQPVDAIFGDIRRIMEEKIGMKGI